MSARLTQIGLRRPVAGRVSLPRMSERTVFTADQAREAGEQIGIDWGASRFDVEQFRMGMDVELEHGTHDPDTNVTDDDVHSGQIDTERDGETLASIGLDDTQLMAKLAGGGYGGTVAP